MSYLAVARLVEFALGFAARDVVHGVGIPLISCPPCVSEFNVLRLNDASNTEGCQPIGLGGVLLLRFTDTPFAVVRARIAETNSLDSSLT